MLTPHQVEVAYNSPTVTKLREILKEVYTPEEFGMFLALPNARFDGKSELEMITDGRDDEILLAAQQLADCVYI